VRLDPAILPKLGHVTMWHDCRHGRITADWRIEAGRVRYEVVLPEGTEAVFAGGGRSALMIDGKTATGDEIALGSGRHIIEFALSDNEVR